MPESLKTSLVRRVLNIYPAFRRTGGRCTYISSDWKEVRVKIPLNWKTRNGVGTIFGGSLYAAVDPIYMTMLIKLLGPDYLVWDKSASIHFKKPGRTTLYADFSLDDAELSAIKTALESQPKVDRDYLVELKDQKGDVHALVEKKINIRLKERPV